MRRPGLVTVANEQVPIATVCRLLGVEVPEDNLRNPKVHCPFGDLNHSDGGIEAAMRIYPESNHAYCFSCQIKFTPVVMWAEARDVLFKDAAAELLDLIGHTPLDMATAWEQATSHRPELDKTLLAEALKTYCRRIEPAWRARQFEPAIAERLSRCLAVLDLVVTEQDVEQWLVTCKMVMRLALDQRNST